MTQQKQHVDIWRKLQLRRQLLKKGGKLPGAAYVPFIGDGDIAAELYADRDIYGVDTDRQRVATVRERLPNATIITGDADLWHPDQAPDLEYSIADFDSYSYPYASFGAWWLHARKAKTVALFFTDGQKQAIHRKRMYQSPDGTRFDNLQGAEKRRAEMFYWSEILSPWFGQAVTPYAIRDVKYYLRGFTMLYWGAVIQRR